MLFWVTVSWGLGSPPITSGAAPRRSAPWHQFAAAGIGAVPFPVPQTGRLSSFYVVWVYLRKFNSSGSVSSLLVEKLLCWGGNLMRERECRLATEMSVVSPAAWVIPDEWLGPPVCPFPFGNNDKAIFCLLVKKSDNVLKYSQAQMYERTQALAKLDISELMWELPPWI